jgi:hypothetical protein
VVKDSHQLKGVENAGLPVGEENHRFDTKELVKWAERSQAVFGGFIE